MEIIIVLLFVGVISLLVYLPDIIRRKREYKIDMELARHGASRSKSSSKKKSSSSSHRKDEDEPEVITKITNPKGNEYKVYGTGNRVICTTEIEGDLIGWGKDYFVVEDRKRSRVYTYDAEGDELGWTYLSDDSRVCSVAQKWFTIQKKRASIKEKYNREADFIESK
ncbi:MAG: hypothetical protein MJZ77_07915 [Bacteroidales bacterium]|nr:hypothetical protein [Bacteroidales bacterium]